MKSVFITFDQAFYERILALLDRQNCRGFSYWQQLQGRGSVKGEPHYGSHAWPSMCSAIMTVVDDTKVEPLLDALHKMDKETEQLGLRAFVWNIERRFESVFCIIKKRLLPSFWRSHFFLFLASIMKYSV
mgnify:CR=1 FL=1